MRNQSMKADLQLRFDRAPNYFALHAAHSSDHETWLLSSNDQILAIASFVQRQAWVDGRIEPVIYMADLRIARRRNVAGIWRSLMPQLLNAIGARTGARLAYCSILRDNRLARQALLRSDRGAVPFEHLHGYSTLSVVARRPWVRRLSRGVIVRRARGADEDRLRTFINEQSRETQLGPVFDQSFFSGRLEQWPEFSLENFYLAFDESEEIVGCLAPWDSSSINRIVLERVSASANAIRVLCNLLTPLTRRPRIETGPSSAMPDIALTHVFVRDRSAHVLAALLDVAQHDIFSSRRHATISLCLYDDDPLWNALGAYWYVSVPMDIYCVGIGVGDGVQGVGQLHSSRRRFPGFEGYLV